MAVKVLLVMAAVLATAAAAAAETKDAEGSEGRFLISTHGDGTSDLTSVTVGLSNIILGGLLLVGLVAIVIFVSRQSSDYKELPQTYPEPSSYSSGPAAEESYAIHRYLENAAARYDH